MARQIVVEIVGDSRKFTGTLNEATGKAETFGGKLKNVGKGVAIGAGVASFNLLTTAIGAVVSNLDEMHQAFLDDEASQARLQNVLENTVAGYDKASTAAEDFASAQQRLGFQDDDVRDSLAQLVGQTRNLAEAQKLVTLAQDISRAKNIDLAQATDIVTKAYNGQARGLAAIGVNVQGAAGGTELLARAMQNVNGAAERYAKTGAGRVAVANAKMAETMEKVGNAIDKVSSVVIPVMVAGLGGLVDAAGEIIAAWTPVVSFLLDTLGPALSFIGDLIRALDAGLGAVGRIASGAISSVQGALGGGGGGGSTPGTINVGGQTGSVNIGKFGGSFATGGVVPGTGPTLIMAHGGETVVPKGQSAGQTIIVNIASFIGSDRDIDRFSDRLAFRLRSTSLS